MKKKGPKKLDVEKIKQHIFSAKTPREKKMWQDILDKLEGKKK